MGNEKQLMARIVRRDGSCPYCGNSRFIIDHIQRDLYLTNSFGEIIDNRILRDNALGICMNCDRTLIFLPTPYGFYPMSELGAIIIDSIITNDEDLEKKLDNPMKPE